VSQLFVVLFAGCMNSDNLLPRYYNDLKRFGDLFSTLPGVDGTSLTVLHADGSSEFGFTGIPNPNVLAGTSAQLLGTLRGIASSAAATDRFVFVASNHGGTDTNGAYLWCWNEETVYASVLTV
jgi:hypothetical protein